MKKRLIPGLALAALLTVGLVACNPTTPDDPVGPGPDEDDKPVTPVETPVNERPLIFYNRQPQIAGTNEVDPDVMNWSDLTFYGGFDAVAGGATQGQMVVDYIKEHAAEMDTNGDGTIGYVLAIGQNSHNDSAARTIGVRTALGTGTTADDTVATGIGEIVANDGTTYKVQELATQEMRDTAGPWSQAVAANTMAGWINQFGDQIDLVVSNNDGMAEGMINQYGGREIPTFGYDANASTLDLILAGGSMKGTISQNHHAQVLTVLQVLRNYFDGETGSALYTKGFKEADKAGNQIKSASVAYDATTKALLAENGIVTSENAQSVKDDVLDPGIVNTTADKERRNILWTVYSATDNFLNQSYVPTVRRYLDFYNFEVTFIYGDGTAESSITNSFVNLGNYDAYVVNMVETSSGALYEDLLDQAS